MHQWLSQCPSSTHVKYSHHWSLTNFGITLIYSTTRDTQMSNVESRKKKHGIARANFAKRFDFHFQTYFLYSYLFLQFLKTILRFILFHSTGFVSNHKAKTLRDVMQVVSYHIMYSFHDIPHGDMQMFYHVVQFWNQKGSFYKAQQLGNNAGF